MSINCNGSKPFRGYAQGINTTIYLSSFLYVVGLEVFRVGNQTLYLHYRCNKFICMI